MSRLPLLVEPEPGTVLGAVGGDVAPVAWIEPGERFAVRCVDVGYGIEPPIDAAQSRAKVLPANEAVHEGPGSIGPIGVRGAQPGQVLALTFHEIVPSAWGFTYHGGGFPTGWAKRLGVADHDPGVVVWDVDRDAGVATTETGWRVPIAPFLGTVGLAPAASEPVPGWAPRPTGGNLDCRDLVVGTTLYLPVEVDGAHLSLGDGHVAQGGGEVGGMAIETAMEYVELSVELLAATDAPCPDHVSARTHEGLAWFGFAETLDAAVAAALSRLLDALEQHHGISRAEALAFASACADVRVTQVVNPFVGVHVVVPGLEL